MDSGLTQSKSAKEKPKTKERSALSSSFRRLKTRGKLTDITAAVRIETVESSNVSNSVERDTHSDLKLSGGKVDTGNHLGGRMLDLETRVELEEEEGVVGVGVEV